VAGVTVGDVLAMSAVRAAQPTVLAGVTGLSRDVRWVHSAELGDIGPLLREGDLLLSTGIAMPERSTELEDYAASLAESGAAGLVVELGRRWGEVPAALIAACDRLALPLVALAREVRFAAVAQMVGERIVDEQLAELREAQRVHETFTELSIAEAGPREILEAVHRLSGSAVVLESEDHQVLDYRAGPEDISGFLTGWANRSRQVVVEGRTTWDESNSWLLTRVGKRDRAWGRLVVQTAGPPSQRLVALAERAAAALALHRLHDRQRDSVLRRTHHELMLGLLADPTDPDLLRRCELAGLPLSKRKLVGVTLRLRLDSAPGTSNPASLVDDVIAATVHTAHELKLPALICEMEHDVRVLLSVPQSADAVRSVDELSTRLSRRHPVIVAAGRPVARAMELDRTLREAQHVVESIRPGTSQVAVHRLEDVHLRGLLAMLADDDRVRMFIDRELDALREHDGRWHTGLLDVVRALVTHPSKSEAAESLHVSRPVFYDRLAKIGRLMGVDLDDPDLRVSLHVALVADEVARQRHR
jgi:purine catabolism regulator